MELQQGTVEWGEWRKSKIGASEIASVLGCGYHTPLELWEIKKGLRETPCNAAMLKGREFEEQIRQWYEQETGEIMFPAVCEHPEHSWMIASYDGLSDCEKIGLEIKYNSHENHELALHGKLPDKFFWQCQQQIAVKGLDRVDYVSYNEAQDSYAKVEVYPDVEAIARIIEEGTKFALLLESNEAPEASAYDYEERSDALYVSTCEALAQTQEALAGYRYLLQKEKDLKETLQTLSGDRCTYGGGYKCTRSVRKGTVQYKTIPELKDLDLEKYRGQSTIVWRITRISE